MARTSQQVIDALKAREQAAIDNLDAEKQDHLGAQSQLDEMASAVKVEVADADAAGYLRGQGSIVLPDPTSGEKLYSQVEANQIAANSEADGEAKATAVLQPQVDSLASQVTVLQAQVATDATELADAQAKAVADLAAVQTALSDMTAKEAGEEAMIATLQDALNKAQESLAAVQALIVKPAPVAAPADPAPVADPAPAAPEAPLV